MRCCWRAAARLPATLEGALYLLLSLSSILSSSSSSLPTCPLHCNCLFVSLSLRCQLYSSHTAASQHLLQPSAPPSTCSPCPLITPAPPIPPLFLTLPLLPFLPDFFPRYMHHLYLNTCFHKGFPSLLMLFCCSLKSPPQASNKDIKIERNIFWLPFGNVEDLKMSRFWE